MAAEYDEPKTSSCHEVSFRHKDSLRAVPYHIGCDAVRIKLLLVVCSGLCAVVRHKHQLLAAVS